PDSPWACTVGPHARSWNGSLGTRSIRSRRSIPPSSPSCPGRPPFRFRILTVSTRSSTPCSRTDGKRWRTACGSGGSSSRRRGRHSRPSCPTSPIEPAASGNCRRRTSRGSPTPYAWRKVNGTTANRYSPSGRRGGVARLDETRVTDGDAATDRVADGEQGKRTDRRAQGIDEAAQGVAGTEVGSGQDREGGPGPRWRHHGTLRGRREGACG